MNRLAKACSQGAGMHLVHTDNPSRIEREHLRINASRWVRWLKS